MRAFVGAMADEKFGRWWRGEWNERWVLCALALFSCAAWGFIELAEDAPAGEYLARETRMLRALRTADDITVGIGPRRLPEVARDVTALGSAVVLTLIVGLVLAWLTFRGRHRIAWFVLGATLGGWILEGARKSGSGL